MRDRCADNALPLPFSYRHLSSQAEPRTGKLSYEEQGFPSSRCRLLRAGVPSASAAPGRFSPIPATEGIAASLGGDVCPHGFRTGKQ